MPAVADYVVIIGWTVKETFRTPSKRCRTRISDFLSPSELGMAPISRQKGTDDEIAIRNEKSTPFAEMDYFVVSLPRQNSIAVLSKSKATQRH